MRRPASPRARAPWRAAAIGLAAAAAALPAPAALALRLAASLDPDDDEVAASVGPAAASAMQGLDAVLEDPARCVPTPVAMPAAGAAIDLGTVLRGVVCQHARVRQGPGLAEQAQAALDRALGQRRPLLNLSTGLDTERGVSTEWAVSLRLDWVLYDFGSRDAALTQARHALTAVLAEQRAEVLTALGEAAQLFAAAQASTGRWQAARQNVATAQDSARVVEARHAAGAATLAEKLQAQTALAQARLEQSRAHSQWLAARGALALALGWPATRAFDVELDDQLLAAAADRTLDVPALIEEARVLHPRAIAARQRLAEARERVAAVSAERWGTISATAQTGRSRASDQSGLRSSTTASLGWTVPIFDRDVLRSRERDASGLVSQRSAAVDDAVRQVELAVWQQGQAVTAERDAWRESRLVLDTADASLRVASERFRQGVGSFSDVLTAQSAAATARFQVAEARANLRLALSRLAAALGRLGSP